MSRSVAALLPFLLPCLVACLPAVLIPSGGGAEENGAGSVQEEVQGHPDDPWEGMNRPIFAFNEGLDRWVLEPVAKGWDFLLPDPVETGIGNFFDNLGTPVHAANELLQAKPWKAYETVWRLVINSVAGVGGIFDVASHHDVYESDEDFGQTLGYWGTPPGPYLVLPLFGPSNPRDTGGRIVDSFTVPYAWVLPIYVTAPASTVDIVNDRAAVLEDIAAERAAAFDFYAAVRSASIQFRENQVRDREEDPADTSADDLYYFDDEELE